MEPKHPSFTTQIINAKQELQEVFDLLVEGVILLDRNLRVLRVNKIFLQYAGVSEFRDICGRSCESAFTNMTFPCNLELIRQVATDGKPSFKEVTVKGPEGSRWYAINVYPIMRPGATDMQILSVVRDVSAEKEEFEKEKHSASLKAIVHLAGASSHEINQPLGVIVGRAQLLLHALNNPGEMDIDTAKKDLDEIVSQAMRIEEILKRLHTIQDYHTKTYIGNVKILDLERSSPMGKIPGQE
jgi:PAS domain S-box-containing protein